MFSMILSAIGKQKYLHDILPLGLILWRIVKSFFLLFVAVKLLRWSRASIFFFYFPLCTHQLKIKAKLHIPWKSKNFLMKSGEAFAYPGSGWWQFWYSGWSKIGPELWLYWDDQNGHLCCCVCAPSGTSQASYESGTFYFCKLSFIHIVAASSTLDLHVGKELSEVRK